MENSIEEDMKIVEDYLENSAINETDSNFFKNGGWETVDLEIPKSMQHILSDYKRVLKENEELKQEKINNYRMIALAQNEALGYMQGYEDGKKLKTSAIASIVENQQYYIIKKQMEKYEEHIAKLQKENEELKNNTRKNENELGFDVDCDWIALQKILDESEKSNEYILYKNEKWIKEKYCIPVQKVKDKIEGLNSRIEIYREYVEQGIETDVEWVDNVADRETVKVLQELLEGRK